MNLILINQSKIINKYTFFFALEQAILQLTKMSAYKVIYFLSDAVCNFNHIESDQINANHNNIKFIRNVSWNYILNSCTRVIVAPSGSMMKTELVYYPCYNSMHDIPLYNLIIVKYAGCRCTRCRLILDTHSAVLNAAHQINIPNYRSLRQVSHINYADESTNRRVATGQKLLWNSNTRRTI